MASCFLLSGFAALLYETVWLRQFSIYFGTSDQALAVVLGTYMGGLAIGSLIAARMAPTLRRPLLTYGMLELGIGITALMVPLVMALVRKIQIASFGGGSEPPAADELSQILFSFAGAFAATILPTAMMGATLPLLAKHVVSRDEHLGSRIGFLYTINTLGAVLGTLTAAFVCLPAFGLGITTYIGVLINLMVFLLVWRLVRNPSAQSTESITSTDTTPLSTAPDHTAPKEAATNKDSLAGREWILWLIGFSGAVSFCYEVLFTRMLGHFLGGSVFSFAAMLASFLLGLTIGGGIAARLSNDRRRAKIGFYYAQCATGILALASWYGIDYFAQIINAVSEAQENETFARTPIAILVLLPPAIAIGMTFPFAIRVHARDEGDAASSSAKVYACNTIGGVLGAFVTGTYLLPATNYQLTLSTAIVASVVIGGLTILSCELNWRHVAAAITAVVLLGIFYPTQPEPLLRVSPFPKSYRRGVLQYVKTGRSATVTTFDDHGTYAFSTNGLPEAGTKPKGSFENGLQTAAWLGLLPTVVHPETDSMLVVGFGSGVAASNAPRTVSSIDVFELEEGMIEANRQVSATRMNDALSDPRIHVILNDGRNGLALTNKRYDAIVSQPSHPWTAGASHLYTREFAELVEEHLTDNGSFVQWMDAGFVDTELFRSLGATLLDVFPNVQLFQPNQSSLLFFASKQPKQISAGVPKFGDRLTEERLRKFGIQSPLDLICLRSLDDAAMRKMCQGAKTTTDNNNLLALQMLLTSENEEIGKEVYKLINEYDPLCNATPKELADAGIDLHYVAYRRHLIGRTMNAEAIIRSIDRREDQLLAEGQIAIFEENTSLARKKLDAVFDTEPNNENAWFQLFALSMIDRGFNYSNYPMEKIRSKVSPKHQKVIDAYILLKSNEYEDFGQLDQSLAQVEPDDPAFVIASILRIDWRLKDSNSGSRRERGIECLEMIDEIRPHTLGSKLVLYRMNAAVLAGRPNIALTMAHSIAYKSAEIGNAEADDAFVGESPETLIKYLRHCLSVIDPLQRDPRVEKLRLFGVRYFVAQTLESLERKTSGKALN